MSLAHNPARYSVSTRPQQSPLCCNLHIVTHPDCLTSTIQIACRQAFTRLAFLACSREWPACTVRSSSRRARAASSTSRTSPSWLAAPTATRAAACRMPCCTGELCQIPPFTSTRLQHYKFCNMVGSSYSVVWCLLAGLVVSLSGMCGSLTAVQCAWHDCVYTRVSPDCAAPPVSIGWASCNNNSSRCCFSK